MKRTLLAALLVSCSSGTQYQHAVCALVDVSGTYADQKAEVVNVIRKGLLPVEVVYGHRIVIDSNGDETVGAVTLESSRRPHALDEREAAGVDGLRQRDEPIRATLEATGEVRGDVRLLDRPTVGVFEPAAKRRAGTERAYAIVAILGNRESIRDGGPGGQRAPRDVARRELAPVEKLGAFEREAQMPARLPLRRDGDLIVAFAQILLDAT